MAPETGNDDGEANQNTVFIDTSLDTHLATIVSDSDTVSDLKKKIMLEHRQCFPAIGDIKIHCLKVKRRGNFYHLSDSMLVKSAFSATKTNWFVSVDASHLDQDTDFQPFDKHKAQDLLALPWVTDSRSIDRHDNHGSPSVRLKMVPFVNQKVPSVDQLTFGDSFKDVSKNLEQDRSSIDKLDSIVLEKMHTENNDLKSKKRTRDVHKESLIEGASDSGLSVKKKRKTQRIEGNVKASEEDKLLTFDTDKVINNGDSFEHKLKSKDLSDERTRINKGENCIVLDQVPVHCLSPSVIFPKASLAEYSVPPPLQHQARFHLILRLFENLFPLQHLVNGQQWPTQRIDGNVKASEEDKLLTFDTDKVINNEDSFEHKLKSKDLSDERTRINKGENCIVLDQVAIVVRSQDVGEETNSRKDVESSETVPDVAVVVEQNIQQEMSLEISQKEKDNELVQKTVMGNELPSSSMTFIKKLNNINKDVMDSSQQDVGSTVQESAGDQIDKEKQGPEVKLPNRRKRAKKTSVKNKDESLVKHADNLVGDIALAVSAPVFDEKIVDERNVVSEKTIIDDSKKGNEMIVKEVEIAESTESHKSRVNVKSVEEKSSTELKDTLGSRRKKKSASRNDESVIKHTNDTATVTNEENVWPQSERKESLEITSTEAEISRIENNISQINAEGIIDNSEKLNDTVGSRKKKKSASRNDESVIKHTHDTATVTNEENVLPQSERKESLEVINADISRNEKNISQVNAEGINGNSEKQNDIMDGMKKRLRKRKNEKPAARNENKSISKHANSDICENVKEGESSLPDAEKKDDKVKEKDPQIFYERVVKKAKKNQKSSVTVTPPQDLPSGRQSADLELESKKSQTVDHNHLPEEASMNVTVSEVSKVNNEADIPKDESHKIVFMDYFTPGHQPEKNASIDSGKNGKLSVEEKKLKKKTFKPPHLETAIQSRNFISENENNSSKVPSDMVRDPNKNIDQFKTPKRIDALKTVKSVHESSSSSSLKSFGRSVHNQKSNKQELVLGQTRVKTSKKSAPIVKSLLNTPGTIFGNDNDESSADDNAAVNSDSSTRTPSRTSSSSSSSSGESDSSLDSRRNGSLAVKRKEGGAKRSMNSQSKKMSIADLLRSSSRFKKAKLTASQIEDTESQSVDFVPESQLMTLG